MDVWQIDKLFLFIAFVIPGFISIKAYQLLYPSNVYESKSQLIDAIAYSSINYALLLVPIYLVETLGLKSFNQVLYFGFYIFVLFVAPILWAVIWNQLRTNKYIQQNIPHPTQKSWDFIFAQRKPYWLKVTLKNGNVMGGLYSDKSFASSSSSVEEIYIEESWIISEKGAFVRKKNNTAGLLILSNEISHIEFRNYN